MLAGLLLQEFPLVTNQLWSSGERERERERAGARARESTEPPPRLSHPDETTTPGAEDTRLCLGGKYTTPPPLHPPESVAAAAARARVAFTGAPTFPCFISEDYSRDYPPSPVTVFTSDPSPRCGSYLEDLPGARAAERVTGGGLHVCVCVLLRTDTLYFFFFNCFHQSFRCRSFLHAAPPASRVGYFPPRPPLMTTGHLAA